MRAVSGWILILLGLGFGIPCAFAIRHLSESGDVWTFMGFPTYGDGPFETVGIQTTVGLLVAFLVVCAGQLVVGVLVIAGTPHAPVLTYLLLPVSLIFWIGFALPVGPPLGLASAFLLHLSRS